MIEAPAGGPSTWRLEKPDVLLAIAPVAGLGYYTAFALEEPDDH